MHRHSFFLDTACYMSYTPDIPARTHEIYILHIDMEVDIYIYIYGIPALFNDLIHVYPPKT